jgi:hypothetical protein
MAFHHDSLVNTNKSTLPLLDSDRFFSVELESGQVTGNWVNNRNAIFNKILNKNDAHWNYKIISIVKGLHSESANTLHIEDYIPGKTNMGIPFSGVYRGLWIGGFCH